MSSSSVPARCDALALEIAIGDERRLLELDAAEDRAFSVGASPNADVRVARRGIPPIAFYLERRGDAVWLVPGYQRGSLRVDAAIVIAPCRIGQRAIVEFSGAYARLALRGVPSGAELAADESTRRARAAYLSALPDDDDRTIVSPGQDGTVYEPRLSDVSRVPAPSPHPERAVGARPSGFFLPGPERSAEPASPSWTGAESAQRHEPGEIPPQLSRETALCTGRRGKPHLWTVLGERPFETAAFVLLIGLVIVCAAIAAAAFIKSW